MSNFTHIPKLKAAVRQEERCRSRELDQHYGLFTGCALHPPYETWRPYLRRLSSLFRQRSPGSPECIVCAGYGQGGTLRTFLPAASLRNLHCTTSAYQPVRSAETLQCVLEFWLHWDVADACSLR